MVRRADACQDRFRRSVADACDGGGPGLQWVVGKLENFKPGARHGIGCSLTDPVAAEEWSCRGRCCVHEVGLVGRWDVGLQVSRARWSDGPGTLLLEGRGEERKRVQRPRGLVFVAGYHGRCRTVPTDGLAASGDGGAASTEYSLPPYSAGKPQAGARYSVVRRWQLGRVRILGVWSYTSGVGFQKRGSTVLHVGECAPTWAVTGALSGRSFLRSSTSIAVHVSGPVLWQTGDDLPLPLLADTDASWRTGRIALEVMERSRQGGAGMTSVRCRYCSEGVRVTLRLLTCLQGIAAGCRVNSTPRGGLWLGGRASTSCHREASRGALPSGCPTVVRRRDAPCAPCPGRTEAAPIFLVGERFDTRRRLEHLRPVVRPSVGAVVVLGATSALVAVRGLPLEALPPSEEGPLPPATLGITVSSGGGEP